MLDGEDQSPVVLFVGSVSLNRERSGPAFSQAGELVQRELISGLSSISRSGSCLVASMEPRAARALGGWGWCEAEAEGEVAALSFFNAPIVKHASFAISLWRHVRRTNPRVVFVYNAEFFKTLALLAYRALSSERVLLCGVVQDVLPVGRGLLAIQRCLDLAALTLWRKFDLVAPISKRIATDFQLTRRVFVLQGGVTQAAFDGWRVKPMAIEEGAYFVFAGALEPYNGVVKLLDYWLDFGVTQTLHIFGGGSLAEYVREKAVLSKTVRFHGSRPHDEVLAMTAAAAGAFCLRYSDGIEAEYFFPSKFYELLVSPVPVIVNRFSGLSDDMLFGCEVVADDLSDVKEVILKLVEGGGGVAAERRTRAWAAHSYRSKISQLCGVVREVMIND